MAMFNHTPERTLLSALILTLVTWAWSLRLRADDPLGTQWDWALSAPFMLMLTAAACLMVTRIWRLRPAAKPNYVLSH